MYDLLILNAQLCDHNEILPVNIAVKNGKIAELLSPEAELPDAVEVLDIHNKLLMPGMIDMHFHCRVPGHSEREDFDTATMAASHGGITMLVEMPIAKPSPHDAETFQNRVDYASERAVIDFAFYGAGATQDADKAMTLARKGAIGYKLFLHQPPAGREDEFCDLCAPTNKALFRSLDANAATGLITCVHAEDDGVISALCEKYREEDHSTYEIQMKTRPAGAEELAVYNAAVISKLTGARLHICHVSSADAADAIRFLKLKNPNLTAETCPHYMLMDTAEMQEHGTLAKVNPPLRDAANRAGLIEGLKDGTLDAISSDHAPFLLREKDVADFLAAPSGMPGIEFFGPSLWDAADKGLFSYPELVRLTSEVPAKLLGIYPQKGTLSVGSDADFVIVDPTGFWKPQETELFTKSHDACAPYLTKEFKGRLLATYVRGRQVYDGEKNTASRGYGRFIPGRLYEG